MDFKIHEWQRDSETTSTDVAVLNVVINMHALWRIMETRQSLKSCCHHDFIEKQSNATLRKSILCMEKVNRSKIAYTTYIPCAKLRKFPHWRIWIEHNYHIIMLHSMIVITWQTLNWNHYSITCWEISWYELPSTQQHASYIDVFGRCANEWIFTINKNKPKSALMENLS